MKLKKVRLNNMILFVIFFQWILSKVISAHLLISNFIILTNYFIILQDSWSRTVRFHSKFIQVELSVLEIIGVQTLKFQQSCLLLILKMINQLLKLKLVWKINGRFFVCGIKKNIGDGKISMLSPITINTMMMNKLYKYFIWSLFLIQ